MSMITSNVINSCDTFFVFKGNDLLVKKSSVIELPDREIVQKYFDQHYAIDWFFEDNKSYFTVSREENVPALNGFCWTNLRQLFAADYALIGLCSRALALLNWRKTARFCGSCGGALQDDKFETARICPFCGNVFFPRISPAVIVLVKKDGKFLLVRQNQGNSNVYTCPAGFLEPGESIEDCAIREVKEVCGISITNIKYCSSQQWPYPDQLLIGVTADWAEGELVSQRNELDEAKWFLPDNLPPVPKAGSMVYELIKNFS